MATRRSPEAQRKACALRGGDSLLPEGVVERSIGIGVFDSARVPVEVVEIKPDVSFMPQSVNLFDARHSAPG